VAGVNTILRLAGGAITVAVIVITGAVTAQVADGMINNMDFSAAVALWGLDGTGAYFWAGIALAGLAIVVMLWMIFAPIRNDVRQELQRPPF